MIRYTHLHTYMDFKSAYSRTAYTAFFRDSLLPEDYLVLSETVEIEFGSKYFKQVTFLGKCPSLDLNVYEITHSSLSDARVGLSRDAFKLIARQMENNALILFVPENAENYRLSLVTIDPKLDSEGIKILKEYSNPRRFSFALGKEAKILTPNKQLNREISNRIATIDDLKKRFSVEVVSKEFFSLYKSHYLKFVETLESNHLADAVIGTNIKLKRDFVKKMMGRIVFLYFLQKKGWLGATKDDYTDGDKDFMNNFWNNSEKDKTFYQLQLSRLFFEGLNKPNRPYDSFVLSNGNKVRIPFLNGGLFEEENANCRGIVFDPELFRSLFDFLGTFNFTIDENDPNEQEIGIDPEMLGHIFENLLEDNKDKGAFYTPKEIVLYMTQESLIEYVKSGFAKQKIELKDADTQALENLVRHKVGLADLQDDEEDCDPSHEELLLLHKQIKFLTKHGAILNQLLDSVKICDPAIGSGAFPMGMLIEIYHCKLALNSGLTKKDRAELKRHIIENSIYGVDIEKGAVDIARLRFWLSLVVEEEFPTALPNLDYKIVVGNSLISYFDELAVIDIDFSNINSELDLAKEIKKDLQILVDKQKQFFVSAKKEKLKQEIRNLKLRILEKSINLKQLKINQSKDTQINLFNVDSVNKVTQLFYSKELDGLLKKIGKLQKNEDDYFQFFDWKLDFPEVLNTEIAGVNNGFDIVIGNPPYLRIQGIRKDNPEFADLLSEQYRSATGSFDLYAAFVEKGLKILAQDGILNYIMPSKWTNAAFGKGLRSVLEAEKATNRIISFAAYQVFNASTYTGLHWFKRGTEYLNYIELDKDLTTNVEIKEYLYSLNTNSYNRIPSSKLSASPWVLTDSVTETILSMLSKHKRNLDDVFEKIFTGLQTSKDLVYFLFDCKENADIIVGYSKYLEKYIEIEKQIVKPLLKGDDVHRYCKLNSDKYVIFPYKQFIQKGKKNAIAYEEDEISANFPFAMSYFNECKDAINERENGKIQHEKSWFKYLYPKNLTLFDSEKLYAPDISLGGNFTYDKEGKFYSTTTNYGYIKKADVKESYYFYLALLNSKVMWWYLLNTGTVLANGYFRFKPDYLKPFPVPDIASLEQIKPIEALASIILEINKLDKADLLTDAVPNKHISTYLETVIDGCIFDLYFPDYMKEKELYILGLLQEQTLLKSNFSKENSFALYNSIRSSEIHTRMNNYIIKSPELLKILIQS